jgi:hypothetical protein
VEAGSPHVREIVESLAERAKDGDTAAAGLLLRHVAPPAPRSVIRRASHLADLPPDVRMREIAKLAAEGQITVEHAQALSAFARQEMETSILAPIRAVLLAIKTGTDPSIAISRLVAAAEEIPALQLESDSE